MEKNIIIPAYAPEDGLNGLTRELLNSGFHVIVVNDGSPEPGVFKHLDNRAVLLHHSQNKGKGEALKTGLSYLISTQTEPFLTATVDADGQHRPEDVTRLFKLCEHCPTSLVLGSRTFNADTPARSRIGNKLTAGLFALVSGKHLKDTQTGLRVFGSEMIPLMLETEGSRYEYETNVLLNAVSADIPILEASIPAVYIDHNACSHFHVLRDSCRIWGELLRFGLSSLASFLIDFALFNAFMYIGADVVAANIGARVLSASANYTINRRLVFRSQAPAAQSLMSYAALAAFILAANTICLSLLVNKAGMNPAPAKLVTESVFFVFSWVVQKVFIFGKRKCIEK